jgi:DnaK suppressor protein
MIVSILQLMGFQKALPVHSRAVEATTDHGRAHPARRHEVKASTGKDKKMTVAKSPAKAAVKAAAKPAGKVTQPKPAKAAAKNTAVAAKSKVVAKTAAVKAKVAPAKAKPQSRPAGNAPAKAPVKVAHKAPVSSASKTKAPVHSKATAKPAAKPPTVKPIATKQLAKGAAKSAPNVPATQEKKSMSVSSPSAKAVSAPIAPPVAAVAPKAGRPSSRLAQLTVPSMAQSVASTAAKASYSQNEPLPVIVPVLAASVKKDAKLANNWKNKPVEQLTDAELMAMPDSVYMNDVQLAAFRLKLQTLKRDILSNAGETTEHLREDTSVTPDPADRATIEEEHALELRTRDRERKLLKKIEQSIMRIDAGDYGYCDETGEPIGVGRLLARPTATLSLEAQQRRELKQKMFGD